VSTDEAAYLTYDEAVALLPDDDRIHTFLNPAEDILLGADWDRDHILALLRETGRREVTGPDAQAMGHGLAAWRASGPVFIATRKAGDQP
jgi:hypothetical protein